jgi:hypothetical protein
VKYRDPSGHRECEFDTFNCTPPPSGQTEASDLTKWIVEELNTLPTLTEGQAIRTGFGVSPGAVAPNCVTCSYYILNQLVRDGAPLDVKDKIEEELGQTLRLGDYWFEFSIAGNILYGFYGSAWHISPAGLHLGAGVAQLQDYLRDRSTELGPPSTYFDTPDDYYAIEFGIELYYRGYAPDGIVTVGEFTALLTTFAEFQQLSHRPEPPGIAFNPNWPYNQGYFYNDQRMPEPAELLPSFYE